MSNWSDPQPGSRFADVDGLRIHFKHAGKGPAVVLLHGSASSLHHFEQVAAMLSDSFDVIRLDLPGFGLTGPRADRDYRIPAYASAVARFVEMLCVNEYAVAGNSLGGNIAVTQTLPTPVWAPPARLILLFPWLDITMSNPGIAQIAPRDPWLSPAGLIECGRAWAGGDDPRDPRLSPINGPLDGLPPLDLFTGTAEIFRPDVRLLAQRAVDAGIPVRLTEADGAFHVCPLAPVPQARTAVESLVHAVAEPAPTR